MDCGATCLRMVASQFGKEYSINKLRKICETSNQGVNIYAISNAAEQIGLNSLVAKLNTKELSEAPMPCILHWNNNHFIVLHKVKGKSGPIFRQNNTTENLKFVIADPATEGLMTLDYNTFNELW